MTKQEQIYNWLIIGLQQSTEQFSEMFYYDKRDEQFFSILLTDYFMFDENLNIAKDIKTTYIKDTFEILVDRIRRIETKDTSIISLPRLGDSSNTADNALIVQQADFFLNINSISMEVATIWEIDEEGTITVDLQKENPLTKKKQWWKLWK